MRRPTKGEIWTNGKGQSWIVAEIRTSKDFLEVGKDDEEVDPDYFQIEVVEGTNTEDIDSPCFELDNSTLPQFLEEFGLIL